MFIFCVEKPKSLTKLKSLKSLQVSNKFMHKIRKFQFQHKFLQANVPEMSNKSEENLFRRKEESSELCYQQGTFRVKNDGGISLQVPYDPTDGGTDRQLPE